MRRGRKEAFQRSMEVHVLGLITPSWKEVVQVWWINLVSKIHGMGGKTTPNPWPELFLVNCHVNFFFWKEKIFQAKYQTVLHLRHWECNEGFAPFAISAIAHVIFWKDLLNDRYAMYWWARASKVIQSVNLSTANLPEFPPFPLV